MKENLVRKALDNLKEGLTKTIIFLKGEEKFQSQPPLYTPEELKELYGIKKDIERFPKKSSD